MDAHPEKKRILNIHPTDRLSESPEGFVRREPQPYAHCLHIQFKSLLWQLPQRNLYRFSQYVAHLASPEGFEKNSYTEGKTVLVMAGHIMMALLEYEEVQQLHQLLQQAELSLLSDETHETCNSECSEAEAWDWSQHALNTLHQPSSN